MPFRSRFPTTTVVALSATLFGACFLATSAWHAVASDAPAGAAPDAQAAARESVVAPLAVRSLLLDVQAVPGGNGRLVAVGERGHVLVSTDGGTTWRQSRVPTRATLTGVYFADVSNGWVVGHDEVILRTTDGGATWTRVHYEPDREQPLLDVWFADANVGLAVGAFATIYRTADGGATWESVEFAPAPPAGSAARATPRTPEEELDAMAEDEEVTEPHLNAVAASSTGKLYLAAEAGNLYRSDDAGATWTQLASPYEGSFFGVLPLDGDVVLAFGLRGHLFRSEDAGATWARVESGSESLLAGGARLADGTVVIAGLAGTVLVSTDGGRTFQRRQQPDRRGFAAAAPGRAGAVLVGESGVRELSAAQLTGRAQS